MLNVSQKNTMAQVVLMSETRFSSQS